VRSDNDNNRFVAMSLQDLMSRFAPPCAILRAASNSRANPRVLVFPVSVSPSESSSISSSALPFVSAILSVQPHGRQASIGRNRGIRALEYHRKSLLATAAQMLQIFFNVTTRPSLL
jgi:hypothetical protein